MDRNLKIPTLKNIWTEAHLEELERNFPECISIEDTNKVYTNIGNRQVVAYIRSRVQGRHSNGN